LPVIFIFFLQRSLSLFGGLFMGKLRNGILGSITGKVSGVVGSTWKGINTLRAYAVPSNPNSTLQQTQRGLFSFVVNVAKLVIGTVIVDLWNPFATTMSGFNYFCKKCLLAITSDSDYANLVMSIGSLEAETITAFTYTTGTGAASIEWTMSGLGNGEGTDVAGVVVIDADNNIAFVDLSNSTRTNGSCDINIGAGRTPTSLHGYLIFQRGSGSTLEVSNSSYHIGAAP
jgi:hypothetical protein